MKRLLFSLICCFSLVFSSKIAAEDNKLSSEQLALRSEVVTFLKEEGFMPDIDSDGDIVFKIEGTKYIVSISDTDENPMYLSFYASFSYPSDYTSDVVLMASKELNRYKGVKVTCYDSSFRISCDLYLRDAESFKESFYKVKSQMSLVQSDILDECKNVSSGLGSISISEIPFIITKLEVANIDNDGTIIHDYGSTIYEYKTQYLKPRITIKPYKTSGSVKLYIKLYKNNELKKGSSSPDDYSYSDTIEINGSSSQTFVLSGWGSDTAGHWPAATYRFEIWYGTYCLGSKTFKVI